MKRNYNLTEAGDMPLTLAQVKANLRIEADDTTQDDLLTAHLAAAVSYCESYCNRVFTVGSTVEFSLPSLCRFIDLPKFLNEVESVQYYDADNELVTIGAEDYTLVKSTYNSSFIELYGTLPTVYDRSDAVLITLTSGAIPECVKAAIHLLIEGFYDGDTTRNEKAIAALLNIEANAFI